MILSCPKCATRFLIEADQITDAGRKVRCSACGEAWRAYPADAAPGDSETPDGDDASSSASDAPPAETVEPGEAEPEAAAPPPVPSVPEAPSSDESAPIVAPIATQTRAAPTREPGLNIALIVVALIAVFVAFYAFRVEIMRLAPATRSAYTAVGLAPRSAPTATPAQAPTASPTQAPAAAGGDAVASHG
ncbi:MAG: zinc-ribbon domain-containing protein [Alphaproteobacteria bacterium]|nr:zinc-ribbon domain-containing protein [Alphaproteobacteria bacterium]